MAPAISRAVRGAPGFGTLRVAAAALTAVGIALLASPAQASYYPESGSTTWSGSGTTGAVRANATHQDDWGVILHNNTCSGSYPGAAGYSWVSSSVSGKACKGQSVVNVSGGSFRSTGGLRVGSAWTSKTLTLST